LIKLILLGPPGAGKGTQAKLLAKTLNIPHVSTGDMLRDQMRENSQLGKEVADFVKSGELVPDVIVIQVAINRLSKQDAQKGFILDGFPRTLNQAQQLKLALDELKTDVDLVIYFETSPEVSISRLSGRRVCRKCNANFHLVNMTPQTEGVCDFCKGKLFLRDDDREETVKKRLAIYVKESASLITYYQQTGKLEKISGDLEATQANNILMDLFQRKNLLVTSDD